MAADAVLSTRLVGRLDDVTVVVPAFNEQDSIRELVEQIEAAFTTRPDLAFSIVIVDDGSSDGTWDAIVATREQHPVVRGIRLRRNFGKASALAVGADAATGPILITMDADLQDDPAEIPRFLDALGGRAGPGVGVEAGSPGSALEAPPVPAVQPDHLDGVRGEAARPQLRLQGGPP